MTKALDPMEKSLRAAEAAHAKLNGKRLGDDRDRFYQAVVDAKAAGASMKEIGERVGISGARVHQIVRDYG